MSTAPVRRAAAAPLPRPAYRDRLSAGIVHLGAGGFHRSHQAVYLDELFGAGRDLDWGVVGVGTTAADRRLHDALAAQDHLWTVETRHADGRTGHQVVGSMVEHLHAPLAAAQVLDRLAAPATRWVTLTITEGGYPVVPGDAPDRPVPALDEALLADLARAVPTTATGLLVRALARRRAASTPPFAVVSCDNLQANGHVARAAVVGAAAAVDADLARWVEDTVAFPSSMVDRITPVTTAADVARVAGATGWADACPVVAEPFRQWVLEEVAGPRPRLEEVGVQVVADVAAHEKLKLRVLNGGHQALAWAGLARGHASVAAAAADPLVRRFVERFWHDEVLVTLDPVAGTDPAAYADAVLARWANPHVPDTLLRLAAHSGDRVPGFVLAAAAGSARAGRPLRRTAALVALWAEGARTHPVAAPPAAAVVGVDALLADRALLGPLVDHAGFAADVRAASALLRRDGAHALLAAAVGGNLSASP